MTQNTGPSIKERAAMIAAALDMPDFHADVLINAIDDITRIALAEQAARLANALAYCAEADNESMEQARTIRAQAIEIERLAGVIEIHRKATTTWRESCHQAWRDLSAARAEIDDIRSAFNAQFRIAKSYEGHSTRDQETIAQLRIEAEAARDALILHLPTHGPIEPDELADDMINDGIAAIKRRNAEAEHDPSI